MKWKNQIWVFDDIIDKQQQEKIRDTLLGRNFPWFFVDDITGGGSRDKRPGFSHSFVKDGSVISHEEFIKMLEPLWRACLEKLMEKTQTKGDYAFIKARTFMQVPLNTISGSRLDAHHIDLLDEHFALLYYVCDSDGDTVLFENRYSKANPKPPEPYQLKEKKRVTPKQGRVVIFDGYFWHTATQPENNVRCIINTDIIQNG